MKNQFDTKGDVTTIFLRRRDGTTIKTLIDTSDLPLAQEFPNTWHAVWHEDIKNYYVCGNVKDQGARRGILLHRWLTDPPRGIDVDHKYHDTLDNRRSCNLRVVTKSQNQQNRKGLTVTNKSGTRGVYWHKTNKKWVARLILNNKYIHLGSFRDKDEAGLVALEARQRLMPYAAL